MSAPVATIDDTTRRLIDDNGLDHVRGAGRGSGRAPGSASASASSSSIRPTARAIRAWCAWVNPEITARSDELVEHEEGCLSLPEFYEILERPQAIEVRFLDPDGSQRSLAADGLLARCIQHEVDHLDGVIFVDHLSAVKRNIILRKLAKTKKQKARESA